MAAKGFNLTAEINLRGPSNLRQVSSSIRRQLGNINANVNVNLNRTTARNIAGVSSRLTQLNTILQTTTQNANSATQAFNNLSSAMSQVGSTNINPNIAAPINNVTTTTVKATKAVQQARTEFEEFGRLGGFAIKRFAAFSAVTAVIYGFTNAVNAGLKQYIEFDRQLTRLSQVTKQTKDSLSDITSTITDLSTGLGVASEDLAQVSVTLAQAGFTARDTSIALEALAKSALAPSFDNLNQTVEGSIALMRQFSISAAELEGALGSINSVAAGFAVEAGDIIKAIQRAGGVFAAASNGVSQGTDALNEFIAVFTSVRATTRESAETIATGLRTIFTRIQREDTVEALKDFGVTLTDLEGKFVGPYRAIQLLSQGLSSLDPRDLKFSRIVEELGGFRQIGKVLPLIQQFATAQDALRVAQQGQGSLAADAAKGQLALGVQIQKVREEFTALVRSFSDTGSFKTIVKLGLDLASAFIKVASVAKNLLPLFGLIAATRGVSALRQFGGGFQSAFRPQKQSDGGFIHHFARGGVVPGSGNRDTVPAMLQPGEFVIRKKAVRAIGVDNLAKANKYARGGLVNLKKLSPGMAGSTNIPSAIDQYDELQDEDTVSNTIIRKSVTKADIEKQFGSSEKFKSSIESTRKKEYESYYRTAGEGFAFEDVIFQNPSKFGLLGRYIKAPTPNYPVDLVPLANAAPVEIKYKNEAEPDPFILNKHFRYLLDKKLWKSKGFTPKIDADIPLGNIRVIELADGVKDELYYPQGVSDKTKSKRENRLAKRQQKITEAGFNLGGRVQKFADGSFVKQGEQSGDVGIFDSDMIGAGSKPILNALLGSGKPYEVINGPAGSGKTTLAIARFGSNFVRSPQDFDKYGKFVVLSGAGVTKSGDLSPEAIQLMSRATKTTVLAPPTDRLMKQRQSRLEAAQSGALPDKRSTKQLAGTLKAPTDIDPALFKRFRNVNIVKNYASGGLVEEDTVAGITLSPGRTGSYGYQSKKTQVPVSFAAIEKKLRGLSLSADSATDSQSEWRQIGSGGKTYTVEAATVNEGVAKKFKAILKTQILKASQTAADRLSERIGLGPTPNSSLSDSKRFLQGINEGAIGNLFEDTLNKLKGPPFSTDPKYSFDFPDGAFSSSRNLKALYPAITSRFVDAKSTLEEVNTANMTTKILNRLAEEAQRDGAISRTQGAETEQMASARAQQGVKYTKEQLEQMGYKSGSFAEQFRSRFDKKAGRYTYQLKNLGGFIKEFATGGSVEDTVPALLTPGEFVINKKAASRIGATKLHQMNRADKIGGYNKGGFVGQDPQRLFLGGFARGPRRDADISGMNNAEAMRAVRATDTAVSSMQSLASVLQELGVTGSQTSQLLSRSRASTAEEAHNAMRADLALAQASGASAETIMDLTSAIERSVRSQEAEIEARRLHSTIMGPEVMGYITGAAEDTYRQGLSSDTARLRGQGLDDATIQRMLREGDADQGVLSASERRARAFEEAASPYNAASGLAGMSGADIEAAINSVARDLGDLDRIEQAYIEQRREHHRAMGTLDDAMEQSIVEEARYRKEATEKLRTSQQAEDNNNRRNLMLGLSAATITVGTIVANTIDTKASAFNAAAAAGIQAGTQTFGTGMGFASELGRLGDEMRKTGGRFNQAGARVAKFGSRAVAAGTVLLTLVNSFKAAQNAVQDFKLNLATTQLDNTLLGFQDELARLQRDIKDVDFSDLNTILVNAGNRFSNLIDTMNQEVRFSFTTLGDWIRSYLPTIFGGISDELLRLKSVILQYGGLQAYSQVTDENSARAIFQTIIPQLARAQAEAGRAAADALMSVLKERFARGETSADIIQGPNFESFAETIANADAIIRARILSVEQSGLDDATIAARRKEIIEEYAKQRIREAAYAVEREKESKAVNRAASVYTRSLTRMFQNMNQSVAAAAYSLDKFKSAMDLNSQALSGQAKAGQVQIDAIDVLQNPRGYSPDTRTAATSQAAAIFGSRGDVIPGLLRGAEESQATVMSTINETLQNNVGATNEAISREIRKNLTTTFENLGLPPELADKLSKEVGIAVADLRKSGDDNIDFSALTEKVTSLGRTMDVFSDAQSAAINALRQYQTVLNLYTDQTNQLIDLAISQRDKERTATNILTSAQTNLAKALNRSINLEDVRTRLEQRAAGFTGQRQLDLEDIFQTILSENVNRQRAESARQIAGQRGLAGADDFIKFNNEVKRSSIAMRENYSAMKMLAENTEYASEAMDKIRSAQEKIGGRVSFIEKLVTSTPEELESLNGALMRLQNNMNGQQNTINNSVGAQKAYNEAIKSGATAAEAMRAAQGAFAQERGETLSALNEILPFLGDSQQAGNIRANVLESMLRESGMGVTPLFQQVLNSLRNPEIDPGVAAAIQHYNEANALQAEANKYLAALDAELANDIANKQTKALIDGLKNVVLKFESQELRDINDSINKLIPIQNAPGAATGGLIGGTVYAAAGQMINFQPKGTDTVPAMLTPGEFVVNRSATQKNLPLLKAINSKKYQSGGSVKYYAGGGEVAHNFGNSDNLHDSKFLSTQKVIDLSDANSKQWLLDATRKVKVQPYLFSLTGGYGQAPPKDALEETINLENLRPSNGGGDIAYGVTTGFRRTGQYTVEGFYDQDAANSLVVPREIKGPDSFLALKEAPSLTNIRKNEFAKYKQLSENLEENILDVTQPMLPKANAGGWPKLKRAPKRNLFDNPAAINADRAILTYYDPGVAFAYAIGDAEDIPTTDEKYYNSFGSASLGGFGPFGMAVASNMVDRPVFDSIYSGRTFNKSVIASKTTKLSAMKNALKTKGAYTSDNPPDLAKINDYYKAYEDTFDFLTNGANQGAYKDVGYEADVQETIDALENLLSGSKNYHIFQKPNILQNYFEDVPNKKQKAINSLTILPPDSTILSDAYEQYLAKPAAESKNIIVGGYAAPPRDPAQDWLENKRFVIHKDLQNKTFGWLANINPADIDAEFEEKAKRELEANNPGDIKLRHKMSNQGRVKFPRLNNIFQGLGDIKVRFAYAYDEWQGQLYDVLNNNHEPNNTGPLYLPHIDAQTVFDGSIPPANMDKWRYINPDKDKLEFGIHSALTQDPAKLLDLQDYIDAHINSDDVQKAALLPNLTNDLMFYKFDNKRMISKMYGGIPALSNRLVNGKDLDISNWFITQFIPKAISNLGAAAGKIDDPGDLRAATLDDNVLPGLVRNIAQGSLQMFGRRRLPGLPFGWLSRYIGNVPRMQNMNADFAKNVAGFASGVLNQAGGWVDQLINSGRFNRQAVDYFMDTWTLLAGASSAFGGIATGNTTFLAQLQGIANQTSLEDVFRSMGGGLMMNRISGLNLNNDWKQLLTQVVDGGKSYTVGAGGTLTEKEMIDNLPKTVEDLKNLIFNPYNEFPDKNTRSNLIEKFMQDLGGFRAGANAQMRQQNPDQRSFYLDRNTFRWAKERTDELKQWYGGIGQWVGQDYLFDKNIQPNGAIRTNDFLNSYNNLGGARERDEANVAHIQLGLANNFGPLPTPRYFTARAARGFQTGGMIYAEDGGQMVHFKPRGTDTVPAMLTPGEFVINRKATQRNLPLLQAINNGSKAYSDGGVVYAADGTEVPRGSNVRVRSRKTRIGPSAEQIEQRTRHIKAVNEALATYPGLIEQIDDLQRVYTGFKMNFEGDKVKDSPFYKTTKIDEFIDRLRLTGNDTLANEVFAQRMKLFDTRMALQESLDHYRRISGIDGKYGTWDDIDKLDNISNVLSVLGLTPGIGAVFDILNLPIEAIKGVSEVMRGGSVAGAATNMGVALASVAPVIGQFAAGTKLTSKAMRSLNEIENLKAADSTKLSNLLAKGGNYKGKMVDSPAYTAIAGKLASAGNAGFDSDKLVLGLMRGTGKYSKEEATDLVSLLFKFEDASDIARGVEKADTTADLTKATKQAKKTIASSLREKALYGGVSLLGLTVIGAGIGTGLQWLNQRKSTSGMKMGEFGPEDRIPILRDRELGIEPQDNAPDGIETQELSKAALIQRAQLERMGLIRSSAYNEDPSDIIKKQTGDGAKPIRERLLEWMTTHVPGLVGALNGSGGPNSTTWPMDESNHGDNRLLSRLKGNKRQATFKMMLDALRRNGGFTEEYQLEADEYIYDGQSVKLPAINEDFLRTINPAYLRGGNLVNNIMTNRQPLSSYEESLREAKRSRIRSLAMSIADEEEYTKNISQQPQEDGKLNKKQIAKQTDQLTLGLMPFTSGSAGAAKLLQAGKKHFGVRDVRVSKFDTFAMSKGGSGWGRYRAMGGNSSRNLGGGTVFFDLSNPSDSLIRHEFAHALANTTHSVSGSVEAFSQVDKDLRSAVASELVKQGYNGGYNYSDLVSFPDEMFASAASMAGDRAAISISPNTRSYLKQNMKILGYQDGGMVEAFIGSLTKSILPTIAGYGAMALAAPLGPLALPVGVAAGMATGALQEALLNYFSPDINARINENIAQYPMAGLAGSLLPSAGLGLATQGVSALSGNIGQRLYSGSAAAGMSAIPNAVSGQDFDINELFTSFGLGFLAPGLGGKRGSQRPRPGNLQKLNPPPRTGRISNDLPANPRSPAQGRGNTGKKIAAGAGIAALLWWLLSGGKETSEDGSGSERQKPIDLGRRLVRPGMGGDRGGLGGMSGGRGSIGGDRGGMGGMSGGRGGNNNSATRDNNGGLTTNPQPPIKEPQPPTTVNKVVPETPTPSRTPRISGGSFMAPMTEYDEEQTPTSSSQSSRTPRIGGGGFLGATTEYAEQPKPQTRERSEQPGRRIGPLGAETKYTQPARPNSSNLRSAPKGTEPPGHTVIEEPRRRNPFVPYATGGIVYANQGMLVPYQPKGTDTVPAMLTPGEFVVNRAATQKNLPLLKAINNGSKGYSSGGIVYAEDGMYLDPTQFPFKDGILYREEDTSNQHRQLNSMGIAHKTGRGYDAQYWDRNGRAISRAEYLNLGQGQFFHPQRNETGAAVLAGAAKAATPMGAAVATGRLIATVASMSPHGRAVKAVTMAASMIASAYVAAATAASQELIIDYAAPEVNEKLRGLAERNPVATAFGREGMGLLMGSIGQGGVASFTGSSASRGRQALSSTFVGGTLEGTQNFMAGNGFVVDPSNLLVYAAGGAIQPGITPEDMIPRRRLSGYDTNIDQPLLNDLLSNFGSKLSFAYKNMSKEQAQRILDTIDPHSLELPTFDLKNIDPIDYRSLYELQVKNMVDYAAAAFVAEDIPFPVSMRAIRASVSPKPLETVAAEYHQLSDNILFSSQAGNLIPRVALHEAGHALLGRLDPDTPMIKKIIEQYPELVKRYGDALNKTTRTYDSTTFAEGQHYLVSEARTMAQEIEDPQLLKAIIASSLDNLIQGSTLEAPGQRFAQRLQDFERYLPIQRGSEYTPEMTAEAYKSFIANNPSITRWSEGLSTKLAYLWDYKGMRGVSDYESIPSFIQQNQPGGSLQGATIVGVAPNSNFDLSRRRPLDIIIEKIIREAQYSNESELEQALFFAISRWKRQAGVLNADSDFSKLGIGNQAGGRSMAPQLKDFLGGDTQAVQTMQSYGREELLTTLLENLKNRQIPEGRILFNKIIEALRVEDLQYKASGGMVYANQGMLVPYQPKGTDTVPAMLTPGEFVINRQATQKNLPLLKAINNGTKGYSSGGVVYLQGGGVPDPFEQGFRGNTPNPNETPDERRQRLEEQRRKIREQNDKNRFSLRNWNLLREPYRTLVNELVSIPNEFKIVAGAGFYDEKIKPDNDADAIIEPLKLEPDPQKKAIKSQQYAATDFVLMYKLNRYYTNSKAALQGITKLDRVIPRLWNGGEPQPGNQPILKTPINDMFPDISINDTIETVLTEQTAATLIAAKKLTSKWSKILAEFGIPNVTAVDYDAENPNDQALADAYPNIVKALRESFIAQQQRQQAGFQNNQQTQNASRGGLIYANKGMLVNYQPKGTDTVPAMLTPGEFVVNKAASSKHRELLTAINSSTLSGGGRVNYLQNGTAGGISFTEIFATFSDGLKTSLQTINAAVGDLIGGIQNAAGGVNNNGSSSIANLDAIGQFTSTFERFIDQLKSINLPPEIKVTLTQQEPIRVDISGAEALQNLLAGPLGDMVTASLRAAINQRDVLNENPPLA